MNYLAHLSEDGREQTVAAHLHGTAELCAQFADAFGARAQGYLAGMAHDIGKYSDAFQRRLHGGAKVDHSTAGAVECARLGAELVSACVAGHHGGLPDFGNAQTDLAGDATLYGRLKRGLDIGRAAYPGWCEPLPTAPPPPISASDPYAASLWTRMLYSCLVDADFLDTERFMSGDKFRRGGYADMAALLARFEAYIAPWWTPKTELNRLRCSILQNCIDRAAGEKGLYSLTVPTGGGKTVASLAFALHHARKHGMNRIIYIIPYTSIIEQNARVFRDILGEENVVEHHCGAALDTEEDISANQIRQMLASENWDAPIIVTTAVQFFESLYSNRPSKCRKLHNLANSVLIFDEAQMLPSGHLLPCVAAIASLAEHFGSTAVLCTATQPVLDDLFEKYAPNLPIREICPDVRDLYDRFRRVTFRNKGRLTEDELVGQLSRLEQVLCIVGTRKAAQSIFARLPADGSFHLSTLMIPAHRRRVLQEIRARLREGLPCRVVSTSLIEAGVDVDFPAVYREMAGLDSILQAVGRCNREGKRAADQSVVTIFDGETPPPPLFAISIGAAREALANHADPADPATVNRYFAAYRSLIGENLDKTGSVAALEQGIAGCKLPFRTVAERFHFIDNATKTVYVPIDEGAELIARITAGEASHGVYRKAGQYAVSIYEQHFLKLLEAGDITVLDDESAVLNNLSLYDKQTGLSLSSDPAKAIFI